MLYAIMVAVEADLNMGAQALGLKRVRGGLKEIFLGPAQLFEALRERSGTGATAR